MQALSKTVNNFGRGGNASSVGSSLRGLTQASQQTQQSALAAQKAIAGIGSAATTAASKAIGAMKSIGSSIDRFVVGPARRASSAVLGIGKSALGAVGSLARLAALGVTVFGINAIKEAISFQDQLAKIQTIARLSDNALTDLGESLQDRAAEFGIAIEDVTDAQYEFLSAGIGLFKTIDDGILKTKFDAAQTAEALDAASRLAIAGMATQTETTRLLSFALNAYNLNQEKFSDGLAKSAGLFTDASEKNRDYANSMGEAAEVIADQFAKAVEIGVVKASEIASTFATVAASAKVAGIGIDEISAAYASQTVRGVSAARVTVSMNRAIQDLIKPGKQLQELMAKTGKNYAKIAETKGIHVALQEMRTDANKLGVEYATLFKRQEGWRFALNITQDDLSDAAGNYNLYKEVLFQIQHATDGVGTSTEQAEKRMHTVGRELSRVRISFKILSETIGRPLLEPLADLLEKITGIQLQLVGWARNNQKLIGSLGPIIGFASALVALTAGTQGLLFALQPIAPLFGTTATNLRGLATIIGRVTLPLAILVGLIGGFKYAVENSVRGFGAFRDNLKDMEDLAAGVIDVFKTLALGIGHIWTAISDGTDVSLAVDQSVDAIGQSVENLGPAFERVAKFVGRIFVSIGGLILQGLAAAIPAIVGWFEDVAKAILPQTAFLLGAFTRWVQQVVPQIMEGLGNFVREFASWIASVVPVVARLLIIITQAFIDWAASVIPSVIDNLGDIAQELATWIGDTLPVVLDALSTWLGGVVTWVATNVLPAIGDALSSALDGLLSILKQSQFVKNAAEVATTFIAGFIGALAGLVAAIATWLAQNADTIVGLFVEVAGQAVAGIAAFFTKHLDEIVDAGVKMGTTLIGAVINAIVSDPVGVAKAIGAVLVASVVVSTAVSAALFLGSKISAAIFAVRHMSEIASTVLFNVIQKLSVASALMSAAQSLGRALSWAIFYVQMYTEMAIQAISSALANSAKAQAIVGFAKAIGLRIAGFIFAANVWGQLAADAIGGALDKIGAGQLIGKAAALGSKIGVAMRLAIGAALIAVPIVLTIQYVSDTAGDVNLLNETTNAAAAATLDQLKSFRDRVKAALERNKTENFDPIEDFFGLSQQNNLEKQLEALESMITEKSKNFRPVFGPPAPPPKTETQQAADDFVTQFQTAFNRGLEGSADGFAPMDWRNILRSNDATQSAEEIRGKFETTFAEIVQTIKGGQKDIKTTVEGLGKTKIVSDKDRIKSLTKLKKQAEATLAQAIQKGDSVTTLNARDAIAEIDKQITALQNADVVVQDSVQQTAKKQGETKAILATASELLDKGTAALTAAHDRIMERLGRGIGGPAPIDEGPGAVNPVPKPKPPAESDVKAVVDPFKNMRERVSNELTAMETRAAESGTTATTGLANSITTTGSTVITAATNLVTNVKTAISNQSWFSNGQKLVATLIAGMLSKLGALLGASAAIAAAAGYNIRHDSPAKHGPLRKVPYWGGEMVRQFALGMTGSFGRLEAASLGAANAAAIPFQSQVPGLTSAFMVAERGLSPKGAREIVPIGAGQGMGGRYGGGMPDHEIMARQTELLADIAGATRLGAAAAARGASRDPRAGGPLAARSVLQSLKHQSVSRTRGG